MSVSSTTAAPAQFVQPHQTVENPQPAALPPGMPSQPPSAPVQFNPRPFCVPQQYSYPMPPMKAKDQSPPILKLIHKIEGLTADPPK